MAPSFSSFSRDDNGETILSLSFKSNVSSDRPPDSPKYASCPIPSPCRDSAASLHLAGNVDKILIHSARLAGTLNPSLSRLRSLQILSLFDNNLTGGIPDEFAAIGTLFKLNLSRNHFSGSIPDFIGDWPSLRLLDLGGNSFSGGIPANLFRNCFKTRFVSFSHNKLSGPVPTSIANCLNLDGIDFSFNNLSGGFPPQICSPPAINFVSLRSNSLSGTVADKIGGCRSVQFIDLSGNLFSGEAPFGLLALSNLSYFNVSSNDFNGKIPGLGTCSQNLEYIDASRNDLSGEIDSGIAGCKGLTLLDLAFNQLSGQIPSGIGSLKSLSILRLGNNDINGKIPAELGGIIMLMVLDLNNLQLSGEVPATLGQCQFLLELDLSGNGLDGRIPGNIYDMASLKHLDLHHNRLNGTIPDVLGNLTHIEFLDLSENLLTGEIPASLGKLTSLTHLNLSYNNLTGIIPLSPTIQKFNASSFSHNPFLCGPPLNAVCPGVSKRTRVLSVTAIVAIVAAAVILAGVCIISIINILAYRKRQREEEESEILISESTAPGSNGSGAIIGKLVLFSKSLPAKYEDWEAGTKALLDKDCLIGGGSIGTVYKATFEGGVSIAVKKLETLGRIRNQEEFEHEMSRLGSLRHPNLVAFQGYYWSSTTQLILSKFVLNNNLYHHLHGYRYSGSTSSRARGELFWSRRFNIALGTARALAYLHHDCKPQVLHLNIKSTNILLDEEFEAKLSDYGLINLLPILGNRALTKFHTAIGYVAPELASQSLRYSDKCDVYSFGVILLEIVTGRKPVESPGAAEVVILRDYVRRVLEDGTVSGCFDTRLRGFVEAELIQVLKMGLVCTSDVSSKRPSMAEVVQFLESIRPNS
ncbi:uncharacterized protein A4U43_C04F26850 [Asparagus officinalis]|uniref:Protein kinase domain-containing protein n=1 Tax=Asparagus officinalis TaxID=4686 RepID=A0A5P1F8T9_ASPOF|nr:probable LRR receptor-like serine/threonine-protein kinase At1g12460 [Asparagus officinalis]ONK73071.1 uncharacterized protein A4U43_C04F26850 [Asparagus officinalis]